MDKKVINLVIDSFANAVRLCAQVSMITPEMLHKIIDAEYQTSDKCNTACTTSLSSTQATDLHHTTSTTTTQKKHL